MMTNRTTQRGFSVVEMAVALAVGTPLLLAVYSVGFSSADFIATSNSVVHVEERVRTTLDRVVNEVWSSDMQLLDPKAYAPLSADRLTYQRVLGYNGGVLLGPTTRIGIELDPAEEADGVDNDGDGLADEHRLAWRLNIGLPNERTVVLCDDVRAYLEGEVPNGIDDNGNGLVDERGLAFDFVGDMVNVRLTIESPDSDGEIITRTAETSVVVEN